MVKRKRMRGRDFVAAVGAALIWASWIGVQGSAAPRSGGGAGAGAAPRYNRDIRPILAENCFQCHGPDQAKRMAGLRLDLREVGQGVLSPGRPQTSRLLARVFETNPSRRMPPPASHKTLTEPQKTLLRRWIAAGAPYEPHWSFVPVPARVPAPAVRDRAWPREDLDRFVLARLEQAGLRPSPEAAPADWIRRVTLDLTGLPPTPAEVDAFLKEKDISRVVDRLLASPRFGERMAAPWLDLSRYADSYGYQSDQLCPTWPYRDWVVKAFNENLPYDQFLTWQIAGDLLPNATREQQLATAFNRLHRMTNEGGSVPEEWRLEGVADRVNTFSTAVLGLTVECARCHDHKYDPISQRDYYALSAFFNTIDEHGLYDRADIVPSPSLLLPTPAQEQEFEAARTNLARAEQELVQVRQERDGPFRTWMAGRPRAAVPDRIGHFDFEQFDGDALPNREPGAKEGGKRGDVVSLAPGRSGSAALFDGENSVSFPALGRFSRTTPFTIAFWLLDPGRAAEPAVVFQACSGTDTGPHGYDLIVEQGYLTARMFRHWPGNAIAVRARQAVARGKWMHVAVTYDGSSRASGLRLHLDGAPAAVEVVKDHLVKDTRQHTLVFGQRFRDKGLTNGRLDELEIYTRALTPLEVAQIAGGKRLSEALTRPAADESALREYYLSAVDPETRARMAALQAARQRVVAAEEAQFEIAVMREMPSPRPTHVLARGRYDAPRSEANRAERGVPASVRPWPSDLPRNRLGLARWVTQPDHPLTARVAVNRMWAQCFGRGLVETQENFGIQGRPPTHPALLDWLARDFISSGWDTKRLMRKIVLSATYRQASALRPDLQKHDPQNALYARGPSHRLPAETIRDLALAGAGLLDERVGGPPVSPYQPGDLWRESNTMSPAYRQSVGRDLYRRSLYSVWKRTAPLPNMLVFDAVSREVCVARRQTTSTPLQALVLLNDPQYVEAARVLGERAVREGGTTADERVRFAFRRVVAREPHPQEQKLLTALYEQQLAEFSRAPDRATKLLAIGDRKASPDLPASEVAAATIVAQAVLSLDTAIWKR